MAGGGGVVAQEAGRPQAKRAIRLCDVPPGLRPELPGTVLTEQRFAAYIRAQEQETADRERAGEYEHLIYYLLQSERFTREPRIEPALSAYELVRAMDAEERSRFLADETSLIPANRIPGSVLRRAADFVEAVTAGRGDVRLAYFRRFLAATVTAPEPVLERLLEEYGRVMKFLYRKEFLARDLKDPQALEAYLASLYQRRGHSTDTQVEANFAVHTALSVIRAYGEHDIDRVLVIGPGLDFAPRTDLLDVFEPQSYQPFAVADALLGLELSHASALRLHCVDINARVLGYLRGLSPERPTRLQLLSGVPEREDRPFTPEYRDYFLRLGAHIGQEGLLALPPGVSRHLGKSVDVRPEVVRRITADRLNIVTERYDPSPAYDLVVMTNVFSYFDPTAQVLALSNIAAMLKEGGYLIHNQPQSSLVAAADRLGLSLADARTVVLAAHPQAALFDRVVVHRKTFPARKVAERPVHPN